MKDKEKLAWIIGLTFLAGGSNVAAIIMSGLTVSHYTGALSYSAIALGEANWPVLLTLTLTIVLFFLGSVLAGYLFHSDQSEQSKLHCILPLLFGITLMVIGFFFNVAYLPILSFGMGLQNGSTFQYEGIRVRTTHITGHLSDAARSLGRILRGNRSEQKLMQFYFSSTLSYFFGAVVAAVLTLRFGALSFIFLGVAYLIMGITLALILFRRTLNQSESVDEYQAF